MIARLVGEVLVALVAVAASIALYDRTVVRPGQRIGIVNLSGITQLHPTESPGLVATGEGAQPTGLAGRALAARLTLALDELAAECRCTVFQDGVVVAGPQTIDLTAALRRKIGVGP